jgi:hypothetical protein
VQRERPIIDMWMVNIPDDRSRIHRCRMRGTIGWKNTYGSPIPPHLKKALKSAGWNQWTASGAIMGASMGALMISMPLLLMNLHWPMWAQWLLLYSFIPVLWLAFDLLLLGPYVRPAYRRDHRRIALRYVRCPWCMYNLLGQAPQGDGCIVCPECGGAWRTPMARVPSAFEHAPE